jgi:pyridinium-3,5-bisthiocarboxylic acid mononucleotide nickel chelatase
MQGSTDRVVQIETNLDDLNPQAYETVIDRLFSLGALDVTVTPVIMKHGRPGVVLAVLAAREKADQVAKAMLRETTTLGVRIQEMTRRVLPRRMESVRVGGHEVRIKVAALGPGEHKAAPEYQDCKRIAEQSGRPVREVMEAALVAFHKQRRRQP